MRTTAQNEKPGLSLRLETPSGVWRQIDPLEHEVGAGDEKCPFVGEPVRSYLKMGRSGVRHRDCAFDVKLTLPTVIEQAEGCVAALLDLGNDEPRADRVNRPGGHVDDVVRRHGLPYDKIRDRAVVHGLAQLLLSQPPIEAQGDLGSRSRAEDVPGFGLAVRQSHRLRIRVVWMNLDGKWLAREQQLEQERRTLRPACRAARTRFHRSRCRYCPPCSRAVGRRHPTASAAPACAQVRSPWCSIYGASF